MKIKTLKKINNKYKIIIENGEAILTYDEVIINNNILYNKDIDEKLIDKIKEENTYCDAYNKVLKYLKYKLRSEKEIKEYMKKQEVNSKDQNKILEKLKRINLINDQIYVKAYIHDRIALKNEGIIKIKKDLLKENIDEKLIDDELSKIDNYELNEKLKHLILKKIEANQKYSNNMLKQKLLNYFKNAGYEKETILEVLDNNMINEEEIIKKEYNKIYNKLKNKYSEYDLKNKIKQKLYQKGFNYDEINKIVN